MWIKKTLIALMLLSLCSAASLHVYESSREEHLARVHQVEGIPVYLLADPVKEYEIVQVEKIRRNSYSLRQAMLKIVQKLQKMEVKEKITGDYDAIIVSDTLDEVMLIRYIDK